MTILISLVIGFAVGCFVNFAITSRTGKARNIGICIAGALIGGALIPMLLTWSSPLIAIVGSLIGIAVLLALYFRFTLHSSGTRA